MSRYKDFDAAVAELEPIVVKLAGREWEFPPSMPARVIAQMLRRGLDEKDDVERDDVVDLWETLIGKERLEEMMDSGATWSQIEALSVYLMEEYGISEPTAEVAESTKDGDAVPPA